MDKYDIVVVAQTNFPNDSAVGNHVRRICHGLQLEGMSPFVLASHARQDSSENTTNGTDKVWTIPYRTYLQERNPLFPVKMLREVGLKLVAALDNILSNNKIKAVLFHGFSFVLLDKMFDLCIERGVPAVPYPVEYFSPHAMILANRLYFDAMRYIRKTLPKSSGIIGISSFWKTLADKFRVPYITIPSYLPDDTDRLKPPAPFSSDSKVFHIVTLGRWVPRECPITLLRSILELAREGMDVRYTAIGNVGKWPTENPAIRFAKKYPELQKRVTITGWVSNEEKERILTSANAFVLLRKESRETQAMFPTRLPEYLVYGKPVVLSQTGDWLQYLDADKHVMYVSPGDSVRELVDTLKALAKNPQKAARLGEAGYRRALEVFSIEQHGKDMAEFLCQIS